ncbi:S24 family peptidase [Albimonas sp. CAU 1670]|uniref:S24 family peptidase n=1 Tax=Albimonas sp. CAU 1670 TaxID=3032599 RepID=UPI0023DBB844|nr:S24 family peptidase [Albimonas sp. CAU 1670]MDF2232205.1 S24 family peptidase [Albimonas sp. CAU 1670]
MGDALMGGHSLCKRNDMLALIHGAYDSLFRLSRKPLVAIHFRLSHFWLWSCMDPILDVIDDALREKGLTDAAASRLAVGHPSLIKNMRLPRSGEKRYNLPALQKLAAVLGLEFYFGPPRAALRADLSAQGAQRSNPSDRDLAAALQNLDARELRRLFEAAYGPDVAPPGEALRPLSKDEDFALVPLHDVELAAGTGFTNDSEEAGAHLLFRRDWLQKVGLATKDARLVRVRGESMMPMLFDADVVLLDTSKTEVPAGRKRASGAHTRYLIALEQDGEARVKWAERPNDDTLVLSSENSVAYRPEVYTRSEIDGMRVIGHVVWWCHTVRD